MLRRSVTRSLHHRHTTQNPLLNDNSSLAKTELVIQLCIVNYPTRTLTALCPK